MISTQIKPVTVPEPDQAVELASAYRATLDTISEGLAARTPDDAVHVTSAIDCIQESIHYLTIFIHERLGTMDDGAESMTYQQYCDRLNELHREWMALLTDCGEEYTSNYDEWSRKVDEARNRRNDFEASYPEFKVRLYSDGSPLPAGD